MSRSRHLVVLSLVLPVALALAAAACGGKKAAERRITVGAFTVPVPSGWKDVSSERAKPGQVGLSLVGREPPVTLILSPAPSPLPFDPTDAAACAENGGRMPGVIGTPTVVELPVGKACVVESAPGKRMVMTVIAVGDQGVMAQCQHTAEADRGACDGVVRGIALAK